MEILTLYMNAGITPVEMLLHLDLMMLRYVVLHYNTPVTPYYFKTIINRQRLQRIARRVTINNIKPVSLINSPPPKHTHPLESINMMIF